VYLLEWLHLVALGDRFGCRFLVTLGGCHHLDGLEQQRRIGTSWWLFVAISRWLWGVCAYPVESQRQPLVDCACHWATSLVVGPCGARGEFGCGVPINRQTTKCWSTQQGRSMPASTWTSGEKSVSQLSLIGILSMLGHSYIMIGSSLLRGGIKIKPSLLHSHNLE